MTDRSRNIAVGLTVIVGLLILAFLIIGFTGMPTLLRSGWTLRVHMSNTGGAQPGDTVHLGGIPIGTVSSGGFVDTRDTSKGVLIVALIKPEFELPGDCTFYVARDNILGKTYVDVLPHGSPRTDKNGKPLKTLPTDGSIIVEGVTQGGGMLDQMQPAIKSISELADNINKLIATGGETETQPSSAATAASGPVKPKGLFGTVARLNQTLDGINAVVSDPGNQSNIRSTLENLSKATSQASETILAVKAFTEDAGTSVKSVSKDASAVLHRADELAQKLIADAEGISQVMSSVNRLVVKIEAGEGTMGKLVNDPKLYQELVQAADDLSRVLKSMNELIENWKGGVKIRQ